LRLLFLFILLAFSNFNKASQEPTNPVTEIVNQTPHFQFLPAINGDYFRHHSEAVGRPFHIYIRLPPDYNEEKSKQYPVVYILDGDSLFPILAANHLFLNYDDKLPQSIIVGISYGSFEPLINKRGFDFSTHSPDAKEGQGGAIQFHQFLKNELLPTIERRYRADARRRILFGQSRGGYMVLYSAFTNPDLFWGRIASNPAFSPGKEQFYSTPATSHRNDLTLVVSSGSKDYANLRKEALEWAEVWGQRSDAPWFVEFTTIENGTHSANSADSYRFGMNAIFNRNSKPEQTPK